LYGFARGTVSETAAGDLQSAYRSPFGKEKELKSLLDLSGIV
jgi:hypothetical protein